MNYPEDLDDFLAHVANEELKRARDNIRDNSASHIHLHPDGNVLNFMIHIQICAEHLMPVPCPQCNTQGVNQ